MNKLIDNQDRETTKIIAEGYDWRLWEGVDSRGAYRVFDVNFNGKWFTVSFFEL